ncbi:MAG: hypothetical protein QNJ74_17445 [Trichodesmium sp. MO_231.B1]|nr:hypothetical protein [Trichodesmium sp. MO_231.B1]
METIETVGTTEAAFLLNISTGRLRVLLTPPAGSPALSRRGALG